MKIFTRTFLYTLTMLVLIAVLANGLIYTLMPIAYTKQKQQDLMEQMDEWIKQLETANREDIVKLLPKFALALQANIILNIGDDRYNVKLWSDEAQSSETASTIIYVSGLNASHNGMDTIPTGEDNTQTDSIMIGGVLDQYLKRNVSSQIIKAQRSFILAGKEGELTASITLAPVDEAVSVILSLLPIALFMCVLVAVVFSLLYARAITRPIKEISEKTRHMTALEQNAKCSITTRDEIGTLAANVNDLYENLLRTIESLETELKKVGAAERAKADFLRAASHELKTPVTAVSVIMDNMILGVGKYKNHEKWLPKCKELVDNLSDTLCEILATSRLEDVKESCATESIDTICSVILEPYAMIAQAKGLSLYIDWSAAFMVTVPPRLLGKALSNIFCNAVSYTAADGKLAVYCKGRSLIVENECIPIPGDQLPRLYEPFYRPDISRSRETGGNGLGLYIIDTILRLLELDYKFEPMTASEGMRFTINF